MRKMVIWRDAFASAPLEVIVGGLLHAALAVVWGVAAFLVFYAEDINSSSDETRAYTLLAVPFVALWQVFHGYVVGTIAMTHAARLHLSHTPDKPLALWSMHLFLKIALATQLISIVNVAIARLLDHAGLF